MTHPFRTLLACWLAVAATGTVVSHRHAGGPGHTHGWGWLGVATPSAPGGPFSPHRHIILLGVETGAIPDGPDSDGSDAPARVVPAFDASSPPGGGSDYSPDGPPVPVSVAALDAPAVVPSAGSAPASTRSPRPVGPARSAVLRL
jgi:hypothetical protein